MYVRRQSELLYKVGLLQRNRLISSAELDLRDAVCAWINLFLPREDALGRFISCTDRDAHDVQDSPLHSLAPEVIAAPRELVVQYYYSRRHYSLALKFDLTLLRLIGASAISNPTERDECHRGHYCKYTCVFAAQCRDMLF